MRLANVRGWSHNQDSMTIEMEYIGEDLSVNHYKWKGRFTKQKVQKWMDELAFAAKVILRLMPMPLKPPLKIRLDGFFKDRRSMPDLHNLIKVTADSIAGALGLNDRDFQVETGEPQIGEPKIVIRIESQKER